MKLTYVLALVSMIAGTALAAPSPSEFEARSPDPLDGDESPMALLERAARRVSLSPEKANNRPIAHSLLAMCWNLQSQWVPLYLASPRLRLPHPPNREALCLRIKAQRVCCLHA